MSERRWMLYGAYGYTGALTAKLAVSRGMSPVLAGRSAEKLEAEARALDLEFRVIDLDEPADLRAGLQDIDAVLHAAGPFSKTSRPMVDACLERGCHYLDITGEVSVFEAVHARDTAARAAGVSLIPGVGFDVVPTDCLAALLAAELGDASHLELAFHGAGGPSVGTSKTIVEGLSQGNAERIHGCITQVGVGSRTRWIPFQDKSRHCVGIPWGDISTAYYSTGIGNIRVYMSLPPSQLKWMRMSAHAAPLLGLGPVQAALKKLVEWRVKGPDAEARARGSSQVWGEVRNPHGDVLSRTLTTPEGYSLTADASLRAMQRVLEGVPAGALTPSMAFGAEFISELDGVVLHEAVRV